jgi:Meiotically up-regulated gene 113
MVYFIKSKIIGSIKIGFCQDNNFPGRLENLQVGSADELILLFVMPYAPQSTEKALHKKFKKYHIRGEWFSPGEELIQYIEIARATFPDDTVMPVYKTELTRFTFK